MLVLFLVAGVFAQEESSSGYPYMLDTSMPSTVPSFISDNYPDFVALPTGSSAINFFTSIAKVGSTLYIEARVELEFSSNDLEIFSNLGLVGSCEGSDAVELTLEGCSNVRKCSYVVAAAGITSFSIGDTDGVFDYLGNVSGIIDDTLLYLQQGSGFLRGCYPQNDFWNAEMAITSISDITTMESRFPNLCSGTCETNGFELTSFEAIETVECDGLDADVIYWFKFDMQLEQKHCDLINNGGSHGTSMMTSFVLVFRGMGQNCAAFNPSNLDIECVPGSGGGVTMFGSGSTVRNDALPWGLVEGKGYIAPSDEPACYHVDASYCCNTSSTLTCDSGAVECAPISQCSYESTSDDAYFDDDDGGPARVRRTIDTSSGTAVNLTNSSGNTLSISQWGSYSASSTSSTGLSQTNLIIAIVVPVVVGIPLLAYAVYKFKNRKTGYKTVANFT
jgi:hypothetical protein